MSQTESTEPAQPRGDQLPIDRSSPLLQIGGGLGVVAATLGMLLLIAACAGLDRALLLGCAVVALGLAGLIISIVGSFAQRQRISQETHILQALFANCVAIVGGGLEVAVALGWKIFYH